MKMSKGSRDRTKDYEAYGRNLERIILAEKRRRKNEEKRRFREQHAQKTDTIMVYWLDQDPYGYE